MSSLGPGCAVGIKGEKNKIIIKKIGELATALSPSPVYRSPRFPRQSFMPFPSVFHQFFPTAEPGVRSIE